MTAPTSPLLDAARAWYDAGFCVIPSHEDGSKRPFGRWKDYQVTRPDWPTLERWLGTGRYTGIGLIMGQASGNAEMVEIEGPTEQATRNIDAVLAKAREMDRDDLGVEDLLTRVIQGCTESSAGGGMHVFQRLTDAPVPGNTKLAMDGDKVIAETRGEGGFVIVWPTPARTGHDKGAVYSLMLGGPDTVAEITAEEHELIHHLFTEALHTEPEPAPAPVIELHPTPAPANTGLSPFDDYRQRTTWRDILEPAGWRQGPTEADGRTHWTRPGGQHFEGTSATTIEDGPMYVFSTNAAMPTDVGLSKGQVYAHLHHGGDLAAATRQLRADGYGDTTPAPELAPWAPTPDTADIPEPDLKTAYVLANLHAVDWHELWANETEEEWIAYPLLPARRLVALYSAPKVGKSLLMLELAAGIASGRELLGNPATEPRTVLYVDFENDPKADIRERLDNMGYGPDDLAKLKLLSFPTMAALDSEKGSLELMAAVEVYGAQVVVIDTVSRAIAGDENENDTWLDFYRHTGLKLKQEQVALVRLDHAGKDETKGQRGGSAKGGDVDAVWRMSRVSDDLYDLVCEMNRMPIDPESRNITLRRDEEPLRHHVIANAYKAKRDELIEELGNKKMPKNSELTLREAKKMARESGISFKDATFTKALWDDYCARPATFHSAVIEGA